jgi:hypothetical protein
MQGEGREAGGREGGRKSPLICLNALPQCNFNGVLPQTVNFLIL